MEDKQAVVLIVAIVAIVAIFVMVKGNKTAQMVQSPMMQSGAEEHAINQNLAGQATKTTGGTPLTQVLGTISTQTPNPELSKKLVTMSKTGSSQTSPIIEALQQISRNKQTPNTEKLTIMLNAGNQQ